MIRIDKILGTETTAHFIGSTYSGITFSTSTEQDRIMISGLSGSSLLHKPVIYDTGFTPNTLGVSPVLLASPPALTNVTFNLPTDPKTGRIFIYRRIDTAATGQVRINVGNQTTQAFRLKGSSTNDSNINPTASTAGCFFFAFNRWWEY